METGKEKVDRICQLLKEETLKPAQEEAKEIIEAAKLKAKELVSGAESKKKQVLADLDKEIEQKQKIFESSLNLSCKNAYHKVRESIEKNLFSEELQKLVQEKLSEKKVTLDFVTAVIHAIEKEGLSADLEVVIPKMVDREGLVKELVARFKDKLQKEKVIDQDFAAGVKVKMVDQKVTIDLSDDALKELLASFLQKDFRQIVFNV